MDIKVTTDKSQTTLHLSGRLDTAASAQASKQIDELTSRQADALTVDAEELTYISSSGLRILLSLAKRYRNFKIVEVNPEVYNVLEMTGFTKIMSVSKAMRRMSVDGCKVIGVGGVGTVYRIDGDTIIKVFREGTLMDEVQTEIGMSKEAFVLGMPTAISFDIVKVGSQYGLVYELLDADTLSACVRREPEKLDDFARLYAGLFRQLHSIEVPQGSSVPSALDHERQQVKHLLRYFSQEDVDLMLMIINSVPAGHRLLHLDLQTKNAMVQRGELMLIDMGEVGFGHPILDLAHAYSAMVTLVGDYEKIIGMPKALGTALWERAINYYFEGLSEETIAHRKAQIEVVSCVRNFSWLALSDSFPEEVINECKALFAERIGNRRDYILEVCKSLGDWTL